MKLLPLLFAAHAVSAIHQRHHRRSNDTRDLPVKRDGSRLLLDGKPWKAVGANVYWLGLDENVVPTEGEPYYEPLKASYPTKGRITEAMAAVSALGGTAIRSHSLGVSTGNPLSVMPDLGTFNEAAFDTIDWAVYEARRYGLRLLVPLTDNFDYYHGGKYNFLRWNGLNVTRAADEGDLRVQQFYTNETIVASFKNYIHGLLTHVNRYTNISYADDPTIYAYETGNELCGPVWLDMDVPPAWIHEIAAYVKSLAPDKLVVDGTYGVNKSHLAIPEVDIYSSHGYPISVSKLKDDIDLVVSANKTFLAGEYDWIGRGNSAPDADDSLESYFKTIEQTAGAIGSAFWSLFGHNVPDCKTYVDHADGLTLHLGSPKNSARINSRIELIHQHLVRVSRGVSINATAALPEVACPASEDGLAAASG